MTNEPARPGAGTGRVRPKAAPPRVLLVDDHLPNLMALEGLLEPLEVDTVRATSGEEALYQVLQGEYAAILMDVQMPGLDGFETASLIKGRARSRNIPILFVTAMSRERQHVEQGYLSGAVDYLVKPLDPTILRAKVQVYVDLFVQAQTIQRQQRELRRQEQEALKRAGEARFHHLAESLPSVVWAVAPTGDVTYANRAWRGSGSFGPGMSVLELPGVHPADRMHVRDRWRHALATGEPIEWQFRIRPAGHPATRDRYRWHVGRAVPERDEAGEIVGWISSAVDIDERMRVELLLSFAARASLRLASARGAAAMAEVVADLLVPALATAATVKLDSNVEGSPPVEVTRNAPGLTVPGRVVSFPLEAGGVARGKLTAVRPTEAGPFDPDEVIAIEDLARRASVAIGSADLLARAEESRTRAVEASAIKDRFLTAVSHELGAPISHMLRWTSLLVDGKVAPSQQPEVYGTILRLVRTQAGMIDDLLDLARISSGSLRLALGTVTPSTVVEAALVAARPLAHAKSVELRVEHESEPHPLVVDPDRLQQVVWNLVVRAIGASPPGGRVSVRTGRVADRLELSVTDDGPGLSPEVVHHLFEPFRVADPATGEEGLRLGLAISKNLVELHGGTLSVSGDATGARFVVSLPCEDVSSSR